MKKKWPPEGPTTVRAFSEEEAKGLRKLFKKEGWNNITIIVPERSTEDRLAQLEKIVYELALAVKENLWAREDVRLGQGQGCRDMLLKVKDCCKKLRKRVMEEAEE